MHGLRRSRACKASLGASAASSASKQTGAETSLGASATTSSA